MRTLFAIFLCSSALLAGCGQTLKREGPPAPVVIATPAQPSISPPPPAVAITIPQQHTEPVGAPYIREYCRPYAIVNEYPATVHYKDGRVREMILLHCLSVGKENRLVRIMCEPFGVICKRLPYQKGAATTAMEKELRRRQVAEDKRHPTR